jgi:Lrp/AsnC family transcriptional regulator for asnA, asnC and gidA
VIRGVDLAAAAGINGRPRKKLTNPCRLTPSDTDSLAIVRVVGKDHAMAVRERGGVSLDSVAKGIIEQLQQDGRRSYAAIGKAIGLSEAAVRQRVQRLTEAGVVQIVAVTDPLQLGFERQALIGLKTTGDVNTLADTLADIPEVDYVVITAGSFDVIAEVVCEDDDHLLQLLSTQIRSLDGVVATETFVYLKLRKQLYDWGTR